MCSVCLEPVVVKFCPQCITIVSYYMPLIVDSFLFQIWLLQIYVVFACAHTSAIRQFLEAYYLVSDIKMGDLEMAWREELLRYLQPKYYWTLNLKVWRVLQLFFSSSLSFFVHSCTQCFIFKLNYIFVTCLYWLPKGSHHQYLQYT
jgi:hypothetical protein